MTFLQSNSKQALNTDHNIGLFVTIIWLAALHDCYFIFPCLWLVLLSQTGPASSSCHLPVKFCGENAFFKIHVQHSVCLHSRAPMCSAGHSSATWVCWRKELPPFSKCAPVSGPRPLLRLVGEQRCLSKCLDIYCKWTCVSSKGNDCKL